eukprot:snap_masked-scaffold_6-processed-gene-8.20-mRNA-1 protein AED:1.00 eAED:1.00 QI:0/-1/0/0/-1/1/1/0/476
MEKFDVIVVGFGLSASLLLLNLLEYIEEDKLPSLCILSESNLLKKKSWVGTYCTWTEELIDTWLYNVKELGEHIFSNTWTSVYLRDSEGNQHPIAKSYSLINKKKIIDYFTKKLQAVISTGKWHFVEGKVFHAVEMKSSCVLFYNEKQKGVVSYLTNDLEKARAIEGKLVVNCSGHFSQDVFLNDFLLKYPVDKTTLSPRKYQTFVGEKLLVENHGLETRYCCLMDWSIHFGSLTNEELVEGPHSFGYLLVLDENTLFVEETVVLSDDVVSLKLLSKRLEYRKRALLKQLNRACGAGYIFRSKVLYKEKYTLPMGGPFPLQSKRGRMINFGGAGNFGHSATGYMFSFVVKQVPKLAICLLDTFQGKSVTFGFDSALVVQRHLNDLGSNLINSMENSRKGFDFLSHMMVTTFKSPFWYQFMTRNTDFSLPRYLYNMIILALKLNNPAEQLQLLCFFSQYLMNKCISGARRTFMSQNE